MKIEKVWAVYYTATGNMESLVKAAAESAAECLGTPVQLLNFSTPEERAEPRSFGVGDLVFAASPTYAGKLPNKILPDFQSKLVGNGAFAAALVSFGNRSYDNALAELCTVLEAGGFHTLAGGAFVGRHAFADLALDRPNAADLEEARGFGRAVAEKARDSACIPAPVQVPGDANAPYYIPKGLDGEPVKFLKAKPKTHENLCTLCGLCADQCTMGSIDPLDVYSVPGVCIKCQACVRCCPLGAKYFDDPAFLSHKAMLEKNYTTPKANELFF